MYYSYFLIYVIPLYVYYNGSAIQLRLKITIYYLEQHILSKMKNGLNPGQYLVMVGGGYIDG